MNSIPGSMNPNGVPPLAGAGPTVGLDPTATMGQAGPGGPTDGFQQGIPNGGPPPNYGGGPSPMGAPPQMGFWGRLGNACNHMGQIGTMGMMNGMFMNPWTSCFCNPFFGFPCMGFPGMGMGLMANSMFMNNMMMSNMYQDSLMANTYNSIQNTAGQTGLAGMPSFGSLNMPIMPPPTPPYGFGFQQPTGMPNPFSTAFPGAMGMPGMPGMGPQMPGMPGMMGPQMPGMPGMGPQMPGMPGMPGMGPQMPGMPGMGPQMPGMPGMGPQMPGMTPAGMQGGPDPTLNVASPATAGAPPPNASVGQMDPFVGRPQTGLNSPAVHYRHMDANLDGALPPPSPGPGFAAALHQLNGPDQANFKVVRGFADDEGTRQDLDSLLLSGKLGDRDAEGTSLVANLARLCATPNSTGIDTHQLLGQALWAVDDPEHAIRQGPAGTSAAANVEYLMAKRNPSELVRLFDGLVSPEGWVRGAGGRYFQTVDNSLRPDHTDRTDFDRIMQASFTQQARRGLAHDLSADVAAHPGNPQLRNFAQSYDQQTNHTTGSAQFYDSLRDQFYSQDARGQRVDAGRRLTLAEEAHLLSKSLNLPLQALDPDQYGRDAFMTRVQLAGQRQQPVLATLKGAAGQPMTQVVVNGVDDDGVHAQFVNHDQPLQLGDVTLTPDQNNNVTIPSDLFKASVATAFVPTAT